MFAVFPALFYKNSDEAGYTVIFPDLPGATCGDDEKDALFMAEDFLGASLYDYYVSNKPLPKASSLFDCEFLEDDCYDLSRSFKSLVGIDLSAYVRDVDKRTVRRNVTIPSYLNEMGKAQGLNFSKVLSDALKSELDV